MPKNNNRVKFTEKDPKLKAMVKRRGLGKGAKKNYDTVFNEIYELFGVTPSEIVKIGKKEQKPYKTEDGLIDILDLEDRKVTEYQTEYKDYLDKQGNSEPTKKLKLDNYRALLGEYDIQKPKSPRIKIKKDRIRESDIVSWRDVERAMDISKGIRDKCILIFLATTGMRGIDLVGLNIKDLIKGCKIYFDDDEEHNITNLLKKDPKSIIPCYEIMPSKTDDKSQLAMTFNTPECSEYLWQYLKERIQKNGELKPDDPLFVGRTNKRVSIGSLEKMYQRINDRLGGEKDKNGIYGKFRKHSMRKLFSTTCRKNMLNININSDKTTEIDVVSIFTGHVPPNESNSKVYEAIPDDSEDSYLREIYFKLLPYLSVKDTEVHHINSKEVTELTEKIDILEEQNQQKDIRHQREMEEKDKEIAELKQLIHQTQEQVDEKLEAFDRITSRKTKTDIEHIINNYCQENLNEEDQNKSFVIRKLALDMALENKKDFENTDEYLSSLIKKARIKISMSGKTTEELFNQIMEQNDEDYVMNKQMTNAVREVMKTMTSNTELMEIISDEDYYELQDAIETYLKRSDYDITNLTDSDKTEIVSAVLMEFV